MIFFFHRITNVDEFLKQLFSIYTTVKKQGYKEVIVVDATQLRELRWNYFHSFKGSWVMMGKTHYSWNISHLRNSHYFIKLIVIHDLKETSCSFANNWFAHVHICKF